MVQRKISDQNNDAYFFLFAFALRRRLRGFSADFMLARDVIKLLRAERRRAVRACQNVRKLLRATKPNARDAKFYQAGAIQACDDCCKAIGVGSEQI